MLLWPSGEKYLTCQSALIRASGNSRLRRRKENFKGSRRDKTRVFRVAPVSVCVCDAVSKIVCCQCGVAAAVVVIKF